MADNFLKIRNGISFPGLSSDPANATNGDTYYNTTIGKHKFYLASAWRDLITFTGTPSVKYRDNTSLSLPSATPYSPDGVAIATDDVVLFTNLSSGNNTIHKATVSGASITWVQQALGQDLLGSPIAGDSAYITAGSTYAGKLFYYSGSVWTDYGSTLSGFYANRQLSNLTGTTSIGVDLLADVSSSRNLGSTSKKWNNTYSITNYTNFVESNTNQALELRTPTATNNNSTSLLGYTGAITGTGNSGDFSLYTGTAGTAGLSGNFNLTTGSAGDSGIISIISGDSTAGASGAINLKSGSATAGTNSGEIQIKSGLANTGTTGNIAIESGASTSGTSGTSSLKSGAGATTGGVNIFSGTASAGNSGSITIQTGTATGNRGKVTLSGRLIRLNVPYASDPTADAAGDIYYNTTSQAFKYYDGAAWQSFGGGGGGGITSPYVVHYVSTNTTLPTGVFTPDGIAVVNNDLVLFTSLTTTADRGVYQAIVSLGSVTGWTRKVFGHDTNGYSVDGDFVWVKAGTANADRLFVCVDATGATWQTYESSSHFLSYYADRTLSNLSGTTAVGVTLSADADASRDIGSSALKWKDGWFSGLVYAPQFKNNILGNAVNLSTVAGSSTTGAVNVVSGTNSTSGSSGNVSILSGDSSATSSGGVFVRSGVGSVAATSGPVTVESGISPGITGQILIASGASSGAVSGTVAIKTGNSATSGTGAMSIYTGQGASGNSSGAINVYTSNTSGANSGLISITTGSTTSSGVSGALTLKSGNGVGSGAVLLTSGTGSGANSGSVGVYSGNTDQISGDVSLYSGDGGPTSGNVLIKTGIAPDVGATATGNISMYTGNCTDNATGTVDIYTGNGGNSSGGINITTGTGGTTSGNITLSTGAAGTKGVVIVDPELRIRNSAVYVGLKTNSGTTSYSVELPTSAPATGRVLAATSATATAWSDPVTLGNGSVAIANGVSNTDITALTMNSATHRAVQIDYAIYRDDSLNNYTQTGTLRLIYSVGSNQWYAEDNFSGDNASVAFSFTTGSNVPLRYTSSSMAGTGYVGKMVWKIRNQFGINN